MESSCDRIHTPKPGFERTLTQLKSWRPHWIPACCMASRGTSRSGASARSAVLMPNGESFSSESVSGCGGSDAPKVFHAVGFA